MDKDNMEITKIKVDGKQTIIRLDLYLMERLEKVTRTKLQALIKAGGVIVNDKQVKPSYPVCPQDEIVVSMPSKGGGDPTVVPEDIPLDIVYEDEYILVVNKPAGMVVHPGIGNTHGTLVNAVSYHLINQDLPIMQGNLKDRPGLVHRIDKDTSGLLVLAKDELAMTNLAKQFFDHSIHRRYMAIVWSCPSEKEGTIDVSIGRHPQSRIKNAVVEEEFGGRRAVTHYKVLKDYYYISLVQCELETGRTHQIRVHMKHLGHPLFNDEKYGGNRVLKGTVFTNYKRFVENTFLVIPRQALHAYELGFIHPITSEKMHFTCELPADMTDCLDRWEKYLNSRKNMM